jgi:hypothetical protein
MIAFLRGILAETPQYRELSYFTWWTGIVDKFLNGNYLSADGHMLRDVFWSRPDITTTDVHIVFDVTDIDAPGWARESANEHTFVCEKSNSKKNIDWSNSIKLPGNDTGSRQVFGTLDLIGRMRTHHIIADPARLAPGAGRDSRVRAGRLSL